MRYKDKLGYVYLASHSTARDLKIGFTVNPRKRLQELGSESTCVAGWPLNRLGRHKIEFVGVLGDKYLKDEQSIHKMFDRFRKRFPPVAHYGHELFEDDQSIRDWFMNHPDNFVFGECQCRSWTKNGVCVDSLNLHEQWMKKWGWLLTR